MQKPKESRRTNYVVPEGQPAVTPSMDVADDENWTPEPSLVHTAPMDRGAFDDDDADLDVPDFLK